MRQTEKEQKKIYKGIAELPEGRAGDNITEGCLCLEGGAWRGLYTLGVLDAFMMHDINFRTTIGISAGALSGIGYTAGQIGWGARIDLMYRHDSRYCGRGAMLIEHGITGFKYLFNKLGREVPLDRKRLRETPRRLYVGAANMLTGQIEYFEKSESNIYQAAAASASVPYVSRPVMIGDIPYLDGGCAEKIPYPFAKTLGEKKIIVIKTRDRSYRRKEGKNRAARAMYRRYPAFVESIENANARFNAMTEELEAEDAAGRIFLIAPSSEVTVSRFEGDMDKLGELYWLGYHDAEELLPRLRAYLGEAGA